MNALSRIHGALRPGGVLVDVHPQPLNTRVEIWQQGGVVPVGELDHGEDIKSVRMAQSRLDLVERRLWFATEDRRFFDLLTHCDRVDDWLARRAYEEASGEVPEALLESARSLLRAGGGQLIVREPIRASRLRRLPTPAVA